MHSELVWLKCNTNQVSALLHNALENLIYFNCGLVTGWFRVWIPEQREVGKHKWLASIAPHQSPLQWTWEKCFWIATTWDHIGTVGLETGFELQCCPEKWIVIHESKILEMVQPRLEIKQFIPLCFCKCSLVFTLFSREPKNFIACRCIM